jgi:hypothetical protein
MCGAAFADPYRVKDLPVDKTAANQSDAQTQGRAEALQLGAQLLIERLTLPEDRANARQPIEVSAVARLNRGYQTQGDQKTTAVSGGFRYTGLLTYNFRADDVRAYLEQRGVPYVDSQAAMALIIPVAGGGVDPAAWGNQWTVRSGAGALSPVVGKSDDTVLTPYVGSIAPRTSRPTTADIQSELTVAGADHGVIAEINMQGSQYYVRLVDMRSNVPNPNIGIAGPFLGLQAAQQGAVLEMERAWKAASIVRTSGSTSVSLVATFQDIQQWVKIRKGLETSRLVSNLNVEALTTVGADITFTYAGRPEQLAADLRAKGVDLRNGDGGWVLAAAGQ